MSKTFSSGKNISFFKTKQDLRFTNSEVYMIGLNINNIHYYLIKLKILKQLVGENVNIFLARMIKGYDIIAMDPEFKYPSCVLEFWHMKLCDLNARFVRMSL